MDILLPAGSVSGLNRGQRVSFFVSSDTKREKNSPPSRLQRGSGMSGDL
jgi:hypothetical protein